MKRKQKQKLKTTITMSEKERRAIDREFKELREEWEQNNPNVFFHELFPNIEKLYEHI